MDYIIIFVAFLIGFFLGEMNGYRRCAKDTEDANEAERSSNLYYEMMKNFTGRKDDE